MECERKQMVSAKENLHVAGHKPVSTTHTMMDLPGTRSSSGIQICHGTMERKATRGKLQGGEGSGVRREREGQSRG